MQPRIVHLGLNLDRVGYKGARDVSHAVKYESEIVVDIGIRARCVYVICAVQRAVGGILRAIARVRYIDPGIARGNIDTEAHGLRRSSE